MPHERAHTAGSLLLAVVFGASTLAIDVAQKKSVCFDEPKHIATGAFLWTTGRFIGDDNSPAVGIYGWPAWAFDWSMPPIPEEITSIGQRKDIWTAGEEILTRNGLESSLLRARLGAVALFICLLALVAIEGRYYGGALGALLATTLTAFSPTVIAHAGIASADLPLAVASVLVASAWRRFAAAPGVARGIGLGAALGFSLAAKATALLLPAVVAVFTVARSWSHGEQRRMLWRGSVVAAGVFVVMGAGACGGPGHLRHAIEMAAHRAQKFPPEFFAGTMGARSPWFYPAVLLFKLCILALPFALVEAARRGRPLPWFALVFSVALFAMTALSGYRQGIRFLLPLFPLLAIASAPLGAFPSALARGGVLVAMLAQVTTALVSHPDHIAYWNSLAGGSKGGDRWFVDSNHDWGQDVGEFSRGHREHPDTRIFGALFGCMSPRSNGFTRIEPVFNYPNLPPPLEGYDPAQRTLLAFSVTLLRQFAAMKNLPCYSLANRLLEIEPDLEFGRSIRGYWLTPQRVAELIRDFGPKANH